LPLLDPQRIILGKTDKRLSLSSLFPQLFEAGIDGWFSALRPCLAPVNASKSLNLFLLWHNLKKQGEFFKAVP